jgi:hypothetical protein
MDAVQLAELKIAQASKRVSSKSHAVFAVADGPHADQKILEVCVKQGYMIVHDSTFEAVKAALVGLGVSPTGSPNATVAAATATPSGVGGSAVVTVATAGKAGPLGFSLMSDAFLPGEHRILELKLPAASLFGSVGAAAFGPGDAVVSINGTDITGLSHSGVVTAITSAAERGALKLGIKRATVAEAKRIVAEALAVSGGGGSSGGGAAVGAPIDTTIVSSESTVSPAEVTIFGRTGKNAGINGVYRAGPEDSPSASPVYSKVDGGFTLHHYFNAWRVSRSAGSVGL